MKLVILFLSIVSPIYADDLRGLGSDVLVCDGGELVKSLDGFEADIMLQLAPDFGSNASDPVAMAMFAIERLRRLDPARADHYEPQIQSFLEERRLIANAGHRDFSRDVFYKSIIPRGCSIEQLAEHYVDPLPLRPRYIIEANLWAEMNATQRAYFILHSVVLKEAFERGHKDTTLVRYYVGHLASGLFASMSEDRYASLLESASLPDIEIIGGFQLLADTVMRYSNGSIAGTLVGDRDKEQVLVQNARRFEIFGTAWFHASELLMQAKGDLEVRLDHYSLKFREGVIRQDAMENLRPEGGFSIHSDSGCRGSGDLEDVIVDSQNLLSSSGTGNFYMEMGDPDACLNDEAVRVRFRDRIRFDGQGRVRSGVISEDIELMTTSGRLQAFKEDDYLEFDEMGRVIL